MENRRKFLTAIIKILILMGIGVLISVFVLSLFSGDKKVKNQAVKNSVSLVSLDISDLKKGLIRKVRWDNTEVAILYRDTSIRKNDLDLHKESNGGHSKLNSDTRSINEKYFVYVNRGDSNNCPLLFRAGAFKDICTSNQFDTAGRSLIVGQVDFQLTVPPHYFEGDTLFVGSWLK